LKVNLKSPSRSVIDLHCHILPGLDDGPASMEMALDMCRIAVDDGIRTVVATPHMFNGIHDVTPDDVQEKVLELSCLLQEKQIPLQILPGADVHVTKDLPGILDRNEVLTIAAKGKHLMVELPQDVFPRELQDMLFRVQLKGVTPLISHPERNAEIQKNPGLLRDLILAGSLTQVTAGSIDGTFGSTVQRCALKLLRDNMVHIVATDAHNVSRRPPRLSKARGVVEEEVGKEEAQRFFHDWPALLLEGNYLDPPEPTASMTEEKKKGFWQRLFS